MRGGGGLYNTVLGDGHEGDRGSLAVSILQLPPENLGRFRDAWVEKCSEQTKSGLRLHIYTRNGGNNRPDYADQIATMRSHPMFLFDEDDEFDSTYASFYFAVPADAPDWWVEPGRDKPTMSWDQMLTILREQWALDEPVDTDQRWLQAIEAMGKAHNGRPQ